MDRLADTEIADLASLCPNGLERDVDLSAISQWRIGGRADIILRPSSSEEISALMRWFTERGIRPVVIGLTSNLLFDDAGLRVPCIQIGERMAKVDFSGQQMNVQAGIWIPSLARKFVQEGLSGAEHICGIPGTLGGLICMNGGSQRKGISSNIISVESIDTFGQIRTRVAGECGFGYRQSVFQSNGEIITRAIMQFSSRPKTEIRTEMLAILADRRRKFPRKQPNCGSVFKSNPSMYANIGPPGGVIEQLGFTGKRIGGAMVSVQHGNFIVNMGGATSRDVLILIANIAKVVAESTGYRMETEVRFVRADGMISPADMLYNTTN